MHRYRLVAAITLAGMAFGFLVVQPFAVLSYNLAPSVRLAFHEVAFWKRMAEMIASPASLFMGLSFAFFGGFAGLSLGSWLYHKRCLDAEKLESEKRLAALSAVKELMVTLAHYIRNSNLVIGGFSGRLARQISDPRQREHLQFIHQASQEIEAVIESLQGLTDLNVAQYTSDGTIKMIDLKNELEARLESMKAHPEMN